jgi:hypothetical protein
MREREVHALVPDVASLIRATNRRRDAAVAGYGFAAALPLPKIVARLRCRLVSMLT